jgi:ribonucleotide monophosphatase NagD (HAD superfamily)
MVGDDYNKDIIGAKKAGIGTFRVKNLLDKTEQATIKKIVSYDGKY